MFKKQKEPSKLDEAINEVYREMAGVTADSKEYAAMVKQLKVLHKMKTQESAFRVTPDTALIVAANVLGIVVIVSHERVAVITSKALGLIMRLR
jgi:uncharacterized protein (UPF0335 family)